MKKIALLAVKNEAWIIERCLTILDNFCDVILIADGQSTDGSLALYEKFKKVQLVDDHLVSIKGQNRRAGLLNAARQIEGNNLLFFLDADEFIMFPADEAGWEKRLQQLDPGDVIEVPWLWLWKSPIHYRDDMSVWSDRWLPFVFCDDRKSQYTIGDWHESRIPGLNSRLFRSDEVALVHFATVAKNKFESRQNWCRVMEFLNAKTTLKQINHNYSQTLDERSIKLKILSDECLSKWSDLKIDLRNFEDPELNWYDLEVLKMLALHTPEKFRQLDIWDTNWEYKRQLAIAADYSDVPPTPIKDTRNWEQKIYQTYLKENIENPFWRDINFFKHRLNKLVKRKAPALHKYIKGKLLSN
jgi:glycosyltransferase involved in cell wall biosynthesis